MSSNPQKTANFVTFTEEILNGKLDFLCSVTYLEITHKYENDLNLFKDTRMEKKFQRLRQL